MLESGVSNVVKDPYLEEKLENHIRERVYANLLSFGLSISSYAIPACRSLVETQCESPLYSFRSTLHQCFLLSLVNILHFHHPPC